ncbi:MAG TPA: hypothetical protein DEB73_01240 [Candidatus Magasanikbacteria bacterium]|uniref:Glycosyltransferase n=1 Tax=Candidatus Magasanikbacteria bacterium GW2011_GWA2_41_55 TaxID=1619038 RepID=A0A0G0YSC8_9BACT|nr:MAG: Glycosyltransferase [Candidatus Magasanikbacteria bacterium GW2011_GWA2_41_55]HBV57877.1 hypothetical protein [Candidatus Magasanikbacteria bacterium]HBX16474.1 hypothetical protein [Candidatus Magasanikbacteria bacterium]
MLINIAVPVHNENLVLKENIKKLIDFCARELKDGWFIVIADNASTDETGNTAIKLCSQGDKLKYIFIPKKGKGLAIKTAWQKFPVDYFIFMDADLSTDLSALPRLVEELKNNADIVIGSRNLSDSRTNRSLLRRVISKINQYFIAHWLNLPLTDFSCGFKGINQKIIQNILPLVKNQQWFFDTELLCRARRASYVIKEIPVIWTETLNQKRKSKVGLIRVGWEYLKEITKNRPK